MSLRCWLAGALAATTLAACAPPTAPLNPPTFIAEGAPQDLRAWGMVQVADQRLVLSPGVAPYDLNTPLFSDYAQKLRTIWMPPGVSARYDADAVFAFPVGTVITKTFFYQTAGGRGRVREIANRNDIDDGAGGLDLRRVRLIETRLLIRREAGWTALTYVWNEAQTEATLQRTGAIVPLRLVRANGESERFRYVVPNVTQCAGCHASNVSARRIEPIGPKARHLNREYAYAGGPENQLTHLAAMGYLEGLGSLQDAPRNAVWSDASAPLEARARAYLDANCAHCHNRHGPADTSGLYLDPAEQLGGNFGVCKLPVAAGGGTGNRRFDIVPGHPEASVLIYRMGSTEPEAMMPELGRSTEHREGVALIRDWIAQLRGTCD